MYARGSELEEKSWDSPGSQAYVQSVTYSGYASLTGRFEDGRRIQVVPLVLAYLGGVLTILSQCVLPLSIVPAGLLSVRVEGVKLREGGARSPGGGARELAPLPPGVLTETLVATRSGWACHLCCQQEDLWL